MYTTQSSEPATMHASALVGTESGQNAPRTGVLFDETWKERLRRKVLSVAWNASSLIVLSRHDTRSSVRAGP